MIFKEHAKIKVCRMFLWGFHQSEQELPWEARTTGCRNPGSQWFETQSECMKGHWRNSNFILKAMEFESYEQRHNLISHFSALNQLFINGKYYGFLDWGELKRGQNSLHFCI